AQEQCIPVLDTESTDSNQTWKRFDDHIVYLIRSSDALKDRSCIIYHLEGRFRSALVRQWQLQDSADIHVIDSIGRKLCNKPVRGFADTIIELMISESGDAGYRDIIKLKDTLAQRFLYDESLMDKYELAS